MSTRNKQWRKNEVRSECKALRDWYFFSNELLLKQEVPL